MDFNYFLMAAIVVLVLTSWTTWSLGFSQGYDKGTQDAFDEVADGDMNIS
jgi:hypothetical protein